MKPEEGKKAQNRHLRVGSICSQVLSEVSYTLDVLDLMATYQGRRQLSYYGFCGLDDMREENAWKQKQAALRQMRRQNILNYRYVEDRVEIALTKKGAEEALRLKILNALVLEDGTNCIVVFDIPERLRKVRIELGKFLDSVGFLRIQRSVFISPFAVASFLAELFQVAGLSRSHVRIYYAKEQP